jgi:hypothetical protein
MLKHFFFSCLFLSLKTFAQDTTLTTPVESSAPGTPPDYTWIFSSPRLINSNTVELLSPGILEFRVTHHFGDIAGDNGGVKNFFGLDNAADVRIGFQYGVSKRLNVIVARIRGAGAVRQMIETGFKYRILQQANDSRHPLSMTLFVNNTISAMEESTIPDQDNSYEGFSDRLSQAVQLLIARKFGKLSVQLSPTLVSTSYVPGYDEKALFALGGALRIPVKGKFSLLLDYFHPFRAQSTIDAFKSRGIRLSDPLGVGIEFLTAGHVFHLNFTNATEIAENRFIPRTVTSWEDGEFRWGFSVSRDFDLLWKKKNRR